MTNVMKQMPNSIKVVGTLKSKNLKYAKDQNYIDVIRGDVIVEVKKDDKVNNIRLNVYTKAQTNAGKPNGFYKGFQTVDNEYKDADTYGEDADRVEVTGDISYNVYVDGSDNLRQNNRLRANNFHRIIDSKYKDDAFGSTGVIVLGYKPMTDKDGVETGEELVKAINVGYNGRINKLVDLQVSSALNMSNYVSEQSPFEISFEINNYIKVKDTDKKYEGFGDFKQAAVEKSFTNNLEITGGRVMDYDFTGDQLKEAAKSLRLQVEDAKNNTASKRAKDYVKHDVGFNNALDNAKKAKQTKTQPKPQPKPVEKKTDNSSNPFDNNDSVNDVDFPDSF